MTSKQFSKSITMQTKQTIREPKEHNEWLDKVICKNYKIISPLNKGSFGQIFMAIHQQKNEYYAVKILNTGKDQVLATSVRNEVEVLYKLNGAKGFPRLYYFIQDATHSYIVQTLLGKNLYQILQDTESKRFSLKTVLMFMEQATNRLEFLHKNEYTHRDIKPENFMTGINDEEIHLIDFGFAQKYLIQGKHIEKQRNENVIGTPRFCPICAHNNITQSRSSDFESLGYLAVYFLKGQLPWMNIQSNSRDSKIKLIGQKKASTSFEELCSGLPKQFEDYFRYIFNITFEGEPNYEHIRQLFKKLYCQMGFPPDNKYDWSKLEGIGSQEDLDFNKKQLFLDIGRKSFTADVNIDQIPSNITKRRIEEIHKIHTSEFFYATDLESSEIVEFEAGKSVFDRMQQLKVTNVFNHINN